MTETVAAYKQIKPNVTINIVPQSTDTLISAFQSAVTAKSGPDIASPVGDRPGAGFCLAECRRSDQRLCARHVK